MTKNIFSTKFVLERKIKTKGSFRGHKVVPVVLHTGIESFFTQPHFLIPISLLPEAEFKEFEPRLKFKPRLKYGWFHLKLY